jgi:hypothetical protein
LQVNGEYGSASYHGLDGLRTEFKRASNDSEDTHERIDAGFTLLKWLNRGTMFASRILDNLEVCHASCKFSAMDLEVFSCALGRMRGENHFRPRHLGGLSFCQPSHAAI